MEWNSLLKHKSTGWMNPVGIMQNSTKGRNVNCLTGYLSKGHLYGHPTEAQEKLLVWKWE
jgi:hypothetical protein